MFIYGENMAAPRGPLVGQQAAQQSSQQSSQQIREAEKILSEFSSSLSNYANLLDQLTDRMAALCAQPVGNPQKDSTVSPDPYMSPIGTELSSRIADFDELNRRLGQLLISLTF